MNNYIHGYTPREKQRLNEQSGILEELLHGDISFPDGSRVLEAGCGVGAQTLILSRKSPGAKIISVDRSQESLAAAKVSIESMGRTNVEFYQRDILELKFEEACFDHIFVCFVLEHVDVPDKALTELKRVLKEGGTITLIEGDHGSCFWHPQTQAACDVWNAMVKVQQHFGQDPLIGRRLYPLLDEAGFKNIEVTPRPAYVDSGNPEIKDAALFKILVPMAQTALEQALKMNLITPELWEKGIEEFSRVGNEAEGALFYSWFKGVGIKT